MFGTLLFHFILLWRVVCVWLSIRVGEGFGFFCNGGRLAFVGKKIAFLALVLLHYGTIAMCVVLGGVLVLLLMLLGSFLC